MNLKTLKLAQELCDVLMGPGTYRRINGFDPSKGETERPEAPEGAETAREARGAVRWDLSRYNVVVKQVEGCSDILRGVLGTIEPVAVGDEIAEGLVSDLKDVVQILDRRALEMLAAYDIGARSFLAVGVYCDPRRGVSAIRDQPYREAAQKPSPRYRAKRLKRGK